MLIVLFELVKDGYTRTAFKRKSTVDTGHYFWASAFVKLTVKEYANEI